MFIDTHLHLIDQSRLAYPWLSGAGDLNRDFTYAEYAREAKRLGIETALHMEVDVATSDIEVETEVVRALADTTGDLIRGVIAACRPEEIDFPAYLEKCTADPFVKGLRRVLHVVPDDISEQALFRDNLKRLASGRLTFDICMLARQQPLALTLIDSAPAVHFVLDHCGVPDIVSGAFDNWKRGISGIAQRPNVTAKVSGIVAYADPQTWTVDTIRPYAEHIVSAFGWDRVVWGSDWPVCTRGGGLSVWVGATQAIFGACTPEEREKLYRGNAKRIWNL
ncbi:putative TIM-barrel fold metal-dependent hydrolase [Mycoplana sp. BE70]|uniref:amidohydrolase family protein n=1 Tax=Mycoplana sp. BE70 TaxID=2817775 RepID=UPI00285FA147|nr:amidohydrolase [Mycoplana sp. BE70]MDR6757060.1 putative TIM-barrel fold metal-dependent hydrolase [Mycoplana sp. BE70]